MASKRERISFFVHDLASNPIGRTIALANALKPLYDVEMVGFLISGDEVNAPYRGLFPYKTIRCSTGLKNILGAERALTSLATGEIIYACKPLITSLLPALMAAGVLSRKRRVFLDVDDDHWGNPTFGEVLRDPLCGGRDLDGWLYTRLLHPFALSLDGISVSSKAIQRRYGGVLVRHGPDETEFDPSAPAFRDQESCRRRLGLPLTGKFAVFAGTPRGHKGLGVLVEALLRPEAHNWSLVLVTPPNHPEALDARQCLGERCLPLGFLPYTEMPTLLSAVDAVPLPQLATVFAESQMPAKLLDAMSMAKPIVASRVGDLKEIVGEGERGWMVEPGSPLELASALTEIEANPREAGRRGANARDWFLAEASGSAIRKRLVAMIENGSR